VKSKTNSNLPTGELLKPDVFYLSSLCIELSFKLEKARNEIEYLKKKYDPCKYGYHEWIKIPGVIEDVSCYNCGICASEINMPIGERSIDL